jgi:hypothetical protein
MGVDAEDLIIRPFREVVERGTDAVANAEAVGNDDTTLSERMSKAARAIVREGERALKKLQPIWNAQVEIYGSAFKDAMMAQGRCGDRRSLAGFCLSPPSANHNGRYDRAEASSARGSAL